MDIWNGMEWKETPRMEWKGMDGRKNGMEDGMEWI